MSFPATLADYAVAALNNRTEGRAAAYRLPMGEWAEERRHTLPMTPRTVANNWRSHVSDTAYDLREALTAADMGREAGNPEHIARTARALLRALGEA